MNYIFAGILVLLFLSLIALIYYIHIKAVRIYFRALTKQKRHPDLPPHIAILLIFHPFAILAPHIMLDLKKGNYSEIQNEIKEIQDYKKLLTSIFAGTIILGPLIGVLLLVIKKSFE